MSNAIDSLLLNGKNMHAEIRQAITKASITRAFDSSPTLNLEVFDPKRTLLKSGIFKERTTAQFYDLTFELAQTKKTGSRLQVVMEDLAVAELRRHNTPYQVSKGTVTRIQFVQQLLAAETPWIKLYVDPSVKEPVAQVALSRGSIDTSAADQIDPAYGGGTTSGSPAGSSTDALSASQIAGAAKAAGFTGQNLVIAVAVAFAESVGRPTATNKNTNGSTDYGLWQINSIHKDLLATGTWSDPLSNAKMAFTVSGGGKTWTPWVTYKSGSYKKFMAQAQVAAGAPSADYATAGATTYGESLEDSWTCFKRIFGAVHWRIYADKGNLYAGPDSAFINKDPVVTLREYTAGVNEIDFDIDTGKPTATLTVDCRLDSWPAVPGSVMGVPDLGLSTEKWLCSSVTRSLFSKNNDKIEGASPQPELVEPTSDASDYSGDISSSTSPTSASGQASNGEYIWPVTSRTITSPFGDTDGRSRGHKGLDIDVHDGTPVYASRSGVILQADNSNPNGYGNAVFISHRAAGTDSFVGPVGPAAMSDESRYGHLSGFSCRRGQYVEQGQLIGRSGHTGDATGPHLHFEIRVNGTPVDPLKYLSNAQKTQLSDAVKDNSVSTLGLLRGGASGSW